MTLNYKQLGSSEPLIIMHGLMGMLDNWMTLAKQYADHYEVFVLDARNHGRSESSAEFSYEVMSDDLLEFMDSKNISAANIIGHSMGGKTAMYFAQENPERIEKLIVADIGPKFYPVHHDKIIAGLQAVPLDQLEKRTDAEDYMQNDIPEKGVRQFLQKSLYRLSDGSYDWRFNLTAIEANIENVGEAIHNDVFEGPSLFISGGASKYILEKDKPEIKRWFSNCIFDTIPKAGHWLHAENPTVFLEKTLNFLQVD